MSVASPDFGDLPGKPKEEQFFPPTAMSRLLREKLSSPQRPRVSAIKL